MAKYSGFNGMQGMNMNNLMKQYQRMQKKLQETQEDLTNRTYTAEIGGGAVKATVTGEMKLKELILDKEAVDPEDKETLQDMIVSAVNQALAQAEEDSKKAMGDVTGGLNLGL